MSCFDAGGDRALNRGCQGLLQCLRGGLQFNDESVVACVWPRLHDGHVRAVPKKVPCRVPSMQHLVGDGS